MPITHPPPADGKYIIVDQHYIPGPGKYENGIFYTWNYFMHSFEPLQKDGDTHYWLKPIDKTPAEAEIDAIRMTEKGIIEEMLKQKQQLEKLKKIIKDNGYAIWKMVNPKKRYSLWMSEL